MLRRQSSGIAGCGAGIAAAALVLVLLGSSPARAAAPEFLLRIPHDSVSKGSGPNQLFNPNDVAGDPETGHLFISDFQSARIDEYTAWGTFVKAWGWDVAPEGAPGDTPTDQLEVCTTACQAGEEGAGPGQLSGARAVAVDAAGDVYVFEHTISGEDSQRVQKFGPEGEWLLMLGGEVNKTSGADVCTKADVEAGDVCGAGVPGTDPGHFSTPASYGFMAYGPATDTIFVGDVGRIQEFDTEGNFVRSIPLPGGLAGHTVSGLDVDAAGNFYLTTFGPAFNIEEDAHKLDPTGKLIGPTFEAPNPGSVAVDVDGNVYVTKVFGVDGQVETRKHLPDGTLDGVLPADERDSLRSVATNFCAGSERPGNVYTVHFGLGLDRTYVNAYGSAPLGCEPPPQVPPAIDSQYAISVGAEEAVVRAEINPFFFTDATYFVEYGTSPCSAGGCQTVPAADLTAKPSNLPVRTAGVFLRDLSPGTTYFFRFVAQSGGGGPVVGPDSTFRTFATGSVAPCPNDVFRIGPGALLPDCRAYEMVSPLDKNNGDVVSAFTASAEPTAFYQAAITGTRFTYSSASSFADPSGAPYTSQYMATRGPLGTPAQGWATEAISPPRTRVATLTDFQKNQFKALSTDLCLGWLRPDADAPLAPGAQPEYSNLYRRWTCEGEPAYRALTTAPPDDRKPVYQDIDQQFWVELQGASEDGERAIFVANDNLVGTEAPQIGEATPTYNDNIQLYEHSLGEGLRFVCVLPSGSPVKEACGAGTTTPLGDIASHLLSNLDNAISADGSRIFWTAAPHLGLGAGAGRIYVRIDGTSTVAVSLSVSPEPARFWGASEDGSAAVFSFTAGPFKEDLYRFEVETKTPQLIAKGVRSVMGMSDDTSRIYFASTKALDAGATEGQSNLYLWDDGAVVFVATLSPSDGLFTPSPIALAPANRTARVTPDGLHAAFSSAASLTGYENLDVASGQPDTEAYLYDAAADSLVCVSCNPSGARPSGKGGIASAIVPWERSLYASHALSDDGRRIFFESFEALVLRDTNGVKDVYQWEEVGSGTCDEADATFNPDADGCVELISSGKSPRESIFLDATPSGSDVFVATLSSLVAHDPDSVDVYDVRVGGGFPPPPVDPPPCEGDACQGPAATPEALTPASAVAKPGNPKPRVRCAKGKRRVKRAGRVRCVKRRGGKRSARR